jgi:predicted MFS family arabinose efflux permease
MAMATLPVQATIWTSAVASRFEASRGLALAVALSGAGVAGFIFPVLGTYLIETFGWRTAFAAQGGIWAALTFPLLFLFFRGANDRQRKHRNVSDAPAVLAGVPTAEAMRSFIYVRLFGACLLFTFTIIALVMHFLPILTDHGVSRTAAASVASMIGLFSIVGRLATGYLLDHFRASSVGAIAFLLPIVSCLLIEFAGTQAVAQLIAAAFIGLALGSEIDVVVYLTTRHFGLKNFGAIYGGLLAALSFGTAFGPLAAAAVFDHYGSYSPFLLATIIFMAISSLALATLPQPAFATVDEDTAASPASAAG